MNPNQLSLDLRKAIAKVAAITYPQDLTRARTLEALLLNIALQAFIEGRLGSLREVIKELPDAH